LTKLIFSKKQILIVSLALTAIVGMMMMPTVQGSSNDPFDDGYQDARNDAQNDNSKNSYCDPDNSDSKPDLYCAIYKAGYEAGKHIKFDNDRKDRDNKTGPGPDTGIDPSSIVRLDFDTGNLSQWIKGPQTTHKINNCHEYDYPGANNRLEVVTSPVKQGSYALKVTLTENAIIIANTSGERAELKYCDSPRHSHLFTNGEDVWYHWYTQFSATDFTIPTPINNGNWHVWTQWHGLEGTTKYGVPIGFNLNGNQLNLRVLGAVYDSNETDADITQPNPCFTFKVGECGYLWIEQIEKGKWYEIFLHVKWSTGSDGLVEGWVKKDGATNPTPFVQYKGNTLNPKGSNDTTVYLKQGLYRNSTINVLQTLWHDGMVIAKCPTNTQFNPSTNKCDTI
jgi:hypothetical protein